MILSFAHGRSQSERIAPSVRSSAGVTVNVDVRMTKLGKLLVSHANSTTSQ
jgi:hypothetical protein